MANNAQFPGIQPLRPPVIGSVGPPHSVLPPPRPMQFQTEVPAQQSQPYLPMVSQQFQQAVRINIPMPPLNQQQFPQPLVQLAPRPGQPGPVGLGLPPLQPIPLPELQPNMPQIPNHYIPNFLGPRLPLSSSYTFASSSGAQPNINADATSQYPPISQMNAPPAPGQTWLSSSQSIHPVTPPTQQNTDQSPVTKSATVPQPNPSVNGLSDWIEHTARNKKRYYYNKRTRLSSWEKPLALMTPIERADATTDWKEFMSPDGRKYYYNKVTKLSKWIIPDELKMARAQVEVASGKESQPENHVNSQAAASPSVEAPSDDAVKSPPHVVVSSLVSVEPVADAPEPQCVVASGSPTLPLVSSTETTTAVEVQIPEDTVTSVPSVSEFGGISVTSVNTVTVPSAFEDLSPQDVHSVDGVSAGDKEEANKGVDLAGEVNDNTIGDNMVDQKSVVYENKQEAKSAFKALLKSANVGLDWTWDQAMRVIINDQRYGALRTLGERKQAFNEFLSQKKKKDAEERRVKQKKAREDFKKMLEESEELTSTSRWSKAMTVFEDDERFIAVERTKDREDLFENYVEELKKKERAKSLEEHKRNRLEYVQYLKSCDFITASSQWRKVQDRLEADERCSCLEKIDRLEIFQEYVRDLEKDEEEQRKLRMEELRKAERKNRDEFRKLMEVHATEGTLNAETHWRDYCMKVKDLPAYLAVSSNTSGSTAKDLFEDVAEELQKQYLEDKARVKDAVKLRKISLSSTWTLEDFRAAISDDISRPPVSDTNLKLVFDELQERVREKEEKEAKKRKRLADDFYDLLCTLKEINAYSKWGECIPLFEDRQESWFTGEESFFREIFEKYVLELEEKAKEKERKRREDKARKDKEGKDREKKAKHRRDRERETESRTGKERHRDGTDSDNGDRTEFYEENRRSGKHRDRKHRKRNISSVDRTSFDENDRDWFRSAHRHKH